MQCNGVQTHEPVFENVFTQLGVRDDEPHSFIFVSDDALETTDRLLLLIHGSGVVRAGQWARR